MVVELILSDLAGQPNPGLVKLLELVVTHPLQGFQAVPIDFDLRSCVQLNGEYVHLEHFCPCDASNRFLISLVLKLEV